MRIKRKCARAGLPTSAVRRNASRKRRLLFMVRPFLGCGRGRIDASSCCTSGQQKSKARAAASSASGSITVLAHLEAAKREAEGIPGCEVSVALGSPRPKAMVAQNFGPCTPRERLPGLAAPDAALRCAPISTRMSNELLNQGRRDGTVIALLMTEQRRQATWMSKKS